MSPPSTAKLRFSLRMLVVLLLGQCSFLQAQLVPAGSTWKYRTGGVDPGADWTALNYNETGWNPGGPAPLGANSEGGIQTPINIGPSGAVYPAIFFRRTFVVTNPAVIGSLAARLMRDDGAVVYLNGNVVVRDRVPEGTPRLAFLGSGAVGGADETTFFAQPPIDVTNLVVGTNILAAEVHQDGAGSSDLVFDFELIGNIAPQVTMTSPSNGQAFNAPVNITLAANAQDPDGSIAKVEFYQNNEQIGEDTSSPYSIVWSGAGEGSFQLTAIAFDNNGASVTSAPVAITVSDPNPPRISSVFATTNSVTVSFSKRVVLPSATTVGNYAINNGVNISSAQYGPSPNSNTIILGTSMLLPSTTYTLTVNNVRDSLNQSIAANSQTNFTVLSFTPTGIGNVSPAATVTPVAGGYDISAGGTNVGGTSDQFAFNYQQVTGDFDYKVRLASVSLADTWSQAGLMARDALTANSPFAASIATPSAAGAYFSSRATAGGIAANAGSFGVNYPNTWLRLRRVGSAFTGYASLDGSLWVQLGTATINMQNTIYIGMSVSSRTNGVATTAQFRDFQPVVGGTIGGFASDVEPAGPSSRRGPYAITEIMYNPAPNPNSNVLEFIELYNSNPYFEDISGYRISGDIDFTFPANTVLKGGEYVVLARNPVHLQAAYGGITARVMGPYTNSLPGTGTIRFRNKEDAILLEVNYSSQPPWPAAADGAGHSLVLARPSYGENYLEAWGISDKVGGSPGGYDGVSFAPQRSVVINEFFANSEFPDEDFIELYNHSNVEVDISGCTLSDDPHTNKYTFPSTTKIAPRGYVVVSQTALSFGLSSGGETIYFRNADGSRILDSIRFEAQASGISSGRYPAGAPEIYPLVARTPGAANSAILIRDIVINEIMYKPISGSDDDEYVELYNKGTNAVNLGGWRFTSGIDYRFPSNTVLAANSYLVVAENVAKLMTNYPNLNTNNTYGNYDGSLRNRGERIALSMPDISISTNGVGTNSVVVTNTVYVVVDEVTYEPGGNWGPWANEGGSSLELIDPRANHRLAYNWADSDETAKSSWSTVEATGLMDLGAGTANLFEILSQGEGEFLIDNVELIPSSSATNWISTQNSTFESGQGQWQFRGTHIRSVIDNTRGFGGGRCLHVRASARGDSIANRCIVPIPTPSGTVTMRAKIRWLRGWPEMLLRLHGNYMEAVGPMAIPKNLGTPGAPNSRAISNAPPAIYALNHQPVVPPANQAVVVSAKIDDPNGIASPSVFYRVDPSPTYLQVPMNDAGTAGDPVANDGIYSGTIPGQNANTLVAFYVRASDAASPPMISTYPLSPSPTTLECLVRFGDPVVPSSFGTYRQWMNDSYYQMWRNRPALSNERLFGTFVYGNFRVIHFMSVKWAGSPYHQFGGEPNATGHYSIEVPHDDLFLGTENVNKIHGPGNGAFDDALIQREQACYWLARQLGLPWNYRRAVNMYFNGNRSGGANQLMEDTETPGSDVVDSRFPDDPNGNLYKLQPWFEVDDGTARSLGFANQSWCQLTRFMTISNGVSVHKLARYRHNYLARAVKGSANEFNDVFALIDAADTPAGAAHTANMQAVADMEQWMRTFAVHHSVGDWDHYGSQNSQNMYGYKPTNGRWQLMIWDMNIVLGNSGSWGAGQNLYVTSGGGANMAKLYDNPTFRRMYLRALKELCNGPFLPTSINPMLDAKYASYLASGVNATSPQSIKDYLNNARNSILGTVAGEEAATFKLTGTNLVTTDNNLIILTGEAPVEARTILINGVEWPVIWTSPKIWTIRIPVTAASNLLQIQAINIAGTPLPNMSTNVTVIFTGTPATPESSLVINEVMYNPVRPEASYVEIYNKADFAFDLSGWRMNGLDYVFPIGAIITNRHYLVLAKNRGAFAAAYGASTVAFGQFDGGLDDGGEAISLEKPVIVLTTNGLTLTTNTVYTAIDRIKYDDDLPWPQLADGTGPSLQLVDANQDNSRVSNWNDSEDWRYATYTGTISGTNAAPGTNFLLFLNTVGEVFIDDIVVVTGTEAGVGQNIIVNGDFESPLAGTWTVLGNHSNSVITTSISHSGAGCLRAIASGPGSASSTLRQILPPFPSNTVCTLSFWYRPNTNGTNVTLRTNPGSSFTSITSFRPLVFTPAAANSVAVPLAPYDPLWLNELQPNNVTGLLDNNNEREPWIEIYNSGATPLDLSGYYLTDNYTNDLTKWQFPAGTTLAAGAFKVVWADGQSGQSTPANLHTSFRLNSITGTVALVRLINNQPQITDYLTYSGVGPDLSYGAFPNGQAVDRQIFAAVTPGALNNAKEINVFINEWLAGNTNAPNTLADPADGDFDDWFELYNAGSTAVDLGGYWLTDNLNAPKGFQIPTNGHYVIPPGGFLLVWADGEDGQNSTARPDLHAEFQLSRDGEQIGLFAPNGFTQIDGVSFGAQTNNISEGRYADGAASLYFMTTPTPRGPNSIGLGNAAPTVNPIGDRIVTLGQTLSFTATATDPDFPAQTLSFSLNAGSPSGASITGGGLFTWTPSALQAPSTNTLTVRATDNGVPPASGTRSFVVRVTLPPKAVINLANGQVSLGFGTLAGKNYQILYKDSLSQTDWSPLGSPILANSDSLTVPDDLGANPQRFYRVVQLD